MGRSKHRNRGGDRKDDYRSYDGAASTSRTPLPVNLGRYSVAGESSFNSTSSGPAAKASYERSDRKDGSKNRDRDGPRGGGRGYGKASTYRPRDEEYEPRSAGPSRSLSSHPAEKDRHFGMDAGGSTSNRNGYSARGEYGSDRDRERDSTSSASRALERASYQRASYDRPKQAQPSRSADANVPGHPGPHQRGTPIPSTSRDYSPPPHLKGRDYSPPPHLRSRDYSPPPRNKSDRQAQRSPSSRSPISRSRSPSRSLSPPSRRRSYSRSLSPVDEGRGRGAAKGSYTRKRSYSDVDDDSRSRSVSPRPSKVRRKDDTRGRSRSRSNSIDGDAIRLDNDYDRRDKGRRSITRSRSRSSSRSRSRSRDVGRRRGRSTSTDSRGPSRRRRSRTPDRRREGSSDSSSYRRSTPSDTEEPVRARATTKPAAPEPPFKVTSANAVPLPSSARDSLFQIPPTGPKGKAVYVRRSSPAASTPILPKTLATAVSATANAPTAPKSFRDFSDVPKAPRSSTPVPPSTQTLEAPRAPKSMVPTLPAPPIPVPASTPGFSKVLPPKNPPTVATAQATVRTVPAVKVASARLKKFFPGDDDDDEQKPAVDREEKGDSSVDGVSVTQSLDGSPIKSPEETKPVPLPTPGPPPSLSGEDPRRLPRKPASPRVERSSGPLQLPPDLPSRPVALATSAASELTSQAQPLPGRQGAGLPAKPNSYPSTQMAQPGMIGQGTQPPMTGLPEAPFLNGMHGQGAPYQQPGTYHPNHFLPFGPGAPSYHQGPGSVNNEQPMMAQPRFGPGQPFHGGPMMGVNPLSMTPDQINLGSHMHGPVPGVLGEPSSELQHRPPAKRNSAPATKEVYERIAQVGEGTFGKVYKARNVENGQLVALKRIRMEAEKDGFPITAVREIKLLQSLRHKNVVQLIEMMVSKGHVYMVFQYMDHDLTGVLHHEQISFKPSHLKSLMKQLLEGLDYIHGRGVLHRDLKGSNILCNKKGELKIADFGLARFYQRNRGNDYTNRVITLWYKPPELLFGATVYGAEVDMWSAGCIFLELFTKRPIFQGNDEIHQLDVIFRITGTPNEENWPTVHELPWYELVKPKKALKSELREMFLARWIKSEGGMELTERLLSLDPTRRPTAAEALKMPYFATEEPPPELPSVLALVKGDFHELEAKNAKKRRNKKVEGVTAEEGR